MKRLQKKVCALHRSFTNNGQVIRANPETVMDLIVKSYGSKKLEGLNIRSWLETQPVTNTSIQEGQAIRFSFQNKNTPGHYEQLVEGTSINPQQIQVVKIIRIDDEFGGHESTDFSSKIKATIIDSGGKVTSVLSDHITQGGEIDIENLNLAPGSYRIEGRDTEAGVMGYTYFIIDENFSEFSKGKFLYVLVTDDENIVSDNIVSNYESPIFSDI